jgi:hypothetical protein
MQSQSQPQWQSHASVRGEAIDGMADPLRSMGVSNSQLREMGKRREFVQDIRVESPVDAIVDSGLRKTVFVDCGNGHFEPRLIETGWRIGDDVEVTKGLMPGEQIVISGTFFVDSESRMKAKP